MNGQSDVEASPKPKERIRYRHQAQNKKYGNIYIHFGTSEWKAYADDFRSVTGAEPIHDGIGRWFYYLGQAAKPKYRKTPADPLPKPRQFG